MMPETGFPALFLDDFQKKYFSRHILLTDQTLQPDYFSFWRCWAIYVL